MNYFNRLVLAVDAIVLIVILSNLSRASRDEDSLIVVALVIAANLVALLISLYYPKEGYLRLRLRRMSIEEQRRIVEEEAKLKSAKMESQ